MNLYPTYRRVLALNLSNFESVFRKDGEPRRVGEVHFSLVTMTTTSVER